MTGKPAWRILRPALLVGLPLAAVAVAATVMLSPESQSQPPAAPAPTAAKPTPPAPSPGPPETTIRLAAPPPAPPPPPVAVPEPPPAPTAAKPTNTAGWMALPIDDLRAFAHGGDLRAMEELARRLVSAIGVPQDSQSGAGWLLRAAEAGSPSAAFNVGVMYERGFVVERDSTKAVEWYRKAVDGNVAVAKHNLALLLRDGKGVPRDGKKAMELLRSAALQGMTASMFALGDIYERGDAASKDMPQALAWFAVTVEFEHQAHHAAETPLAKAAQQRVDTLHRILTPAELERAEKIGQIEFHRILAALAPPKTEPPTGTPPPPAVEPAAPSTPQAARPLPSLEDDLAIGWPKSPAEQIRTIQRMLIDLQRLHGKADGIAGPATRAAIIDFEKSVGLRETGKASREVYVAALKALARHDTVARSPLPPPPRSEPKVPAPRIDTPAPPPARVQAPAPTVEVPAPQSPSAKTPPAAPATGEVPGSVPHIDLGDAEPPPPPTSADIARAAVSPAPPVDPPSPPAAKIDSAAATIGLGNPDGGPPPPTSADIARVMPRTEPPKPDPDPWPTKRKEQIRAIQSLLGQLKLMRAAPTGEVGPITFAAIRDYQRMAGLPQTGEPTRELFESLKATRSLIAPGPAGKSD